MPIALEFNGLGYAVLMATPADLEDLVVGFAFSERIIGGVHDLTGFDAHETGLGLVVRASLGGACAERVFERVRHRATDSSCGLCGIENLEQALRPLPKMSARTRASEDAVFRALSLLEPLQPLNLETRAVHGAACCSAEGDIRLVREDVGRHNAFDKMCGAFLRAGMSWDGGFALATSRCSYELVEKSVLIGCPMLATISAPTTLAMRRAREAGLELRVLARRDAVLTSAGQPDSTG